MHAGIQVTVLKTTKNQKILRFFVIVSHFLQSLLSRVYTVLYATLLCSLGQPNTYRIVEGN